MITINVKELFSKRQDDNLLTLYKPPVSRGTYKMKLSKTAYNNLQCAKKPNIAFSFKEGAMFAAIISGNQFFDTKTAKIAKNGSISNKKYHQLLTEFYDINWEERDTFEVNFVNTTEGNFLYVLQPKVELNDAQLMQEAESIIEDVNSIIQEVDSENANQPAEME